MQYVQRYHLKNGKTAEYKRWLSDNKETLKQAEAEGWRYLGTWFTVRGFGRYTCETRWEIEDYSTLGSGFGPEPFQELMKQWLNMVDINTMEVSLLKSTEDVRVLPH